VIAEIAGRARAASPVWAAALREHPTGAAAYGPRVDDRFALGVETIYEGYLVHHATSRLFAPADHEQAILLGDYLYAAGLVEICRAGDLGAVTTLAELIATVSERRSRGLTDDTTAWEHAVAALEPVSDRAAR
jgi:hypothetical protein